MKPFSETCVACACIINYEEGSLIQMWHCLSWQKLTEIRFKSKAIKILPLLHRWNPFFLLDTFFDPLNRISGFDVDLNFLSSKCLHLDHCSTSKPQNKVKGWFLLNVVISKGAPILQLFPSKYQSLLVWGDALLVLHHHPSNLFT